MKRSGIAACLVLALGAAGCGSGEVKVSGVLKMDGQPVEGATVTYMSDDGSKSYSGQTDSAGNFDLTGPQKPGAQPGNYKVVVTKRKPIAGIENMNPESSDYKKMMEKMGKETVKSKMGPGTPGGGGSEVKSELPAVYASISTTPLTAKVPPESQPVTIDIKAKP